MQTLGPGRAPPPRLSVAPAPTRGCLDDDRTGLPAAVPPAPVARVAQNGVWRRPVFVWRCNAAGPAGATAATCCFPPLLPLPEALPPPEQPDGPPWHDARRPVPCLLAYPRENDAPAFPWPGGRVRAPAARTRARVPWPGDAPARPSGWRGAPGPVGIATGCVARVVPGDPAGWPRGVQWRGTRSPPIAYRPTEGRIQRGEEGARAWSGGRRGPSPASGGPACSGPGRGREDRSQRGDLCGATVGG